VSSSPQVSVVIATYNQAQYIAETLESVFAQTLVDREVIVIDDGSTDNTSEVIEPFLDRVRYVRRSNGGVSSAWNLGIEESRGELVAFLASDDRWEPDALERILHVFAQHAEVGLVSVMGREMTADGRLTDRLLGKRTDGEYYTGFDLLRGGWCSWFAVRRRLLIDVGGFDERLRSAEECDLCLRLLPRTRLFALKEPLLQRRVHGDNLSKNQKLNAKEWLGILARLARDQPDFVRKHGFAYRRALGKEHLRLGRELMLSPVDPGDRAASRRHLWTSLKTFPFFSRTYLYLLSNILAPSAFGVWRRRRDVAHVRRR